MTDSLSSLVGVLYYEHDLSQTDIARRLGLSKITVSRTLQKAKETGIVQTTIALPHELDREVGERLARKYGVKEIMVARALESGGPPTVQYLGEVWAFEMAVRLKDNTVIGLGLGETVGSVIHALSPLRCGDVHLVQLIGGLATVGQTNPFSIVQEASRKLHASGTYLMSGVLVDSAQMKKLLFESEAGRRCVEMWGRCDMAIVGLGAVDTGAFLSPDPSDPAIIESLKAHGVVGDLLGHCFNEKGEFVTTEWEERLVSVPIDKLRSIPERIVVAGGSNKVRAVRAALASGTITTLVTDEEVAAEL